MQKIKACIQKYKDILPYLFFGVLTTLVNIVTYWIMAHPLGASAVVGSIVAWLSAVLFAYFTNRKWVFHSHQKGAKAIFKEMLSFFGCRLSTGIIDVLSMYVFVDLLHWNDMFVKIGINVVVVVLNYVASKLLIFKTKQK